MDLDKTLFIVSSKSGGTIETLSHMRYFYERTGGDGSRFCAVTDPGSPLVDLARERGFRKVFENDRRSAAATRCSRISASCRRRSPA